MRSEKIQKIVEVCTCGSSAKENRKYRGRLLGLIDKEEFAKLLKYEEQRKKYTTVRTILLDEIVNNFDRLNGLRLVISVKEIDDKPVQKYLFISNKLALISCTDMTVDTLYITDEDDGALTVQEFDIESGDEDG